MSDLDVLPDRVWCPNWRDVVKRDHTRCCDYDCGQPPCDADHDDLARVELDSMTTRTSEETA